MAVNVEMKPLVSKAVNVGTKSLLSKAKTLFHFWMCWMLQQAAI